MSAKALLAVIILVDVAMIGGYAYGVNQTSGPHYCAQYREVWASMDGFVQGALYSSNAIYLGNHSTNETLLSISQPWDMARFYAPHGDLNVTLFFGTLQTTHNSSGIWFSRAKGGSNLTVNFPWNCAT